MTNRCIQSCPDLPRVSIIQTTKKGGRTDQRTNGRTDTPSYRDARTHLNMWWNKNQTWVIGRGVLGCRTLIRTALGQIIPFHVLFQISYQGGLYGFWKEKPGRLYTKGFWYTWKYDFWQKLRGPLRLKRIYNPFWLIIKREKNLNLQWELAVF